MDRMIWTAVTGMSASMARQRMIASNMANAQTIGFRAEIMRATLSVLEAAGARQKALARHRPRWAVAECTAEEMLPLYLQQGFALRLHRAAQPFVLALQHGQCGRRKIIGPFLMAGGRQVFKKMMRFTKQ